MSSQGDSIVAGGWEWYATFCSIAAGVDTEDKEAAAAVLQTEASPNRLCQPVAIFELRPRKVLPIANGSQADLNDVWANGVCANEVEVRVHGLLQPVVDDGINVDGGGSGGKMWKLLVGKVLMNIWTGPVCLLCFQTLPLPSCHWPKLVTGIAALRLAACSSCLPIPWSIATWLQTTQTL